jgi:membrane protein YdbS with pleckstrin-like domain
MNEYIFHDNPLIVVEFVYIITVAILCQQVYHSPEWRLIKWLYKAKTKKIFIDI